MSDPRFQNSSWIRVSKAAPCAVCGRPDWCTVSGDGNLYKCTRVPSQKVVPAKDGQTSWIHLSKDVVGKFDLKKANKPTKDIPRLKVSEVKAYLKEFKLNLTSERLASAANSLNLSEKSLKAYCIGFCQKPQSYSFPMYGGDGKPCGIRLRLLLDGKKLCVPGSRNGLFIPLDYDPRPIPEGLCDGTYPLLLLLPEGPTDAAAAHDLGFRAIGRPSNAGGAKQLAELLAAAPCKQDIVVVADRDEAKKRPDGKCFWPGIEGAIDLCKQIEPVCGKLRFLMPPDSAKDLRAWVVGGSHGRLFSAISSAAVVNNDWLCRAKEKVERMRSSKPAA